MVPRLARWAFAVATLAACALPVAPAQAGIVGDQTLLVSRPSGDAFLPMPVTNNSYLYGPGVDSSGNLAAFSSLADILSSEDDNRFQNVFVRNRSAGTTTFISRASGAGGAPANGHSYDPGISPDGTKVAFASDADNLVDGDTNGSTDIFLRDLTTNTTTLVSRANGPSGAQSNDYSDDPSVTVTSGGHVLVAFESDATNLVTGDNNNQTDVFLRDVTAGTTLLLSRASDGTLGNGMSRFGYLSADGSAVAFESYASNLDAADSNTSADAYVRHLAGGGTTELVSRATGAAGAKGNGQGLQPRLDATASHVVFASESTNLGVAGGLMHVYRRTLSGTFATEAVDLADGSTSTAGNARAGSGCYSMNSDASQIAFCTVASNLVASPTDNNSAFDVYQRDMGTNATKLISRVDGALGAIGNGDSNFPWMSSDAGVVIFGGGADNLSDEDDDAVYNVYARDGNRTELISQPSSTGTGTRDSMPGGVSRGGRFVVFQSDSDGLVDNDDDSVTNIYMRDNDTGATTLLSRTQDGTAANGNSDSPVISADGTKVAFETHATNLGGDSNGQVVVKDIASGAVTVASLPDGATGGSPGNAEAHDPAISGDGNRVSFVSTAHNLVPGWTTNEHVYVRDLATNKTIGADAVDGTAATPSEDAFDGEIDTSGTKVILSSDASNIVAGLSPGDIFIYLRDLNAHSTTLVSRDANGTPVKATDGHYSSDGPTVLFYAYTPLDPADASSTPYYARNLSTGAVAFIPRATGADGTRATQSAITPTIAADSRIVVFYSRAKELAAAADGHTGHIYYRDLNSFTTDAADRADGADGALANAGAEFYPVISPDGCCIAFSSFGSNLVSGWDNSEYFQAYVRDINPPPPPAPGGGGGGNPTPSGGPGPVTSTRDTVAPHLRLGGPLRQKPLKTKLIFLTVTSDEAATVKVGVTITIPSKSKVFRLKTVTRKVVANKKTTIKLKLTKPALKALKRALRKKRAKIYANAKITARDAAGNVRTAKRKIRLVR